MMTDSEKNAWVEAARRGDELAFQQIFEHYHVSLYNLARRLMRNPEDAQDVVQEAFIKAFRSLPRMRDPGSLGSWLRKIVYRTCIDTIRLKKRKQWQDDSLDEHMYQYGSSRFDPERDAIIQERMNMVERALQLMPPRHRAYIILREIDGLTYNQIGEVLGEPITTVRVTLFRARTQLREFLQQLSGEEK